MKKHKKISAITCLLLTLVVTIIVLYPFVWVFVDSIKKQYRIICISAEDDSGSGCLAKFYRCMEIN